VSLFNLFVTCPRCSLMNEKVLDVIVLHSLWSTSSTSCFKQLTRNVLLRYCTLRTSSRYLRRRSIFKPSNFPLRTSSLISPTTALRYRNHYCIYSSAHKTLSSCHKPQPFISKNGRMPGGAGRRTSTSFEAINASSATGISNLVR